jgi:tetratricopeptide (TPR) repeat protein
MAETPETTLLDRARDASARGDWQLAYELFIEADHSSRLSGPDLPLFAGVAYATGHLDLTIEAWERAYRSSVEETDHLAAAGAAVRVAMHLLFDTALMAPVRGWLARAERLLPEQYDTPVHAWLAVVRSYERLLSGDFSSARVWAARAVAAGTGRDAAATALGRVAQARSMILDGDVERGLTMLNEAALATFAGEIDPLSTGVVYCELVCAFQALGQYDLAEEWTEAMEHWRRGRPVGSIHGRCRIHRAEILRLRGASDDAETEILMACEELRPYLRREFGWPLTELGRIRFRKGNIQGAEEAFLEADATGWDPEPGLALIHLARGDIERAAASIRDALERPSTVPSKEWPPNTDLRRAPLLEAQVEIEIAAGNLNQARAAATELAHVAARFQSKAITAAAAMAHGRVAVAAGDTDVGVRRFEEAARQWDDIGAPYENAIARMALGLALQTAGNFERGSLEVAGALATFKRVGADPRTAPVPPAGSKSQPNDISHAAAFRREGDYWSVVFNGETTRLRDSRGLQYIARLLGDPGRELHVLDLVASAGFQSGQSDFPVVTDRGDAGEVLDARAKQAYRRRLAEIEEDLDRAASLGDDRRAVQAEAEREFLMKELAYAVGLGGRDRRASSASERARSAVTRAIRLALTRVREHNPSLGQHFDRTIRTGAHCTYLPEPRSRVDWKL